MSAFSDLAIATRESEPAAPPFQFGPVYHCFVCGAPANGLRYWEQVGRGHSPLDALAGHIAYLRPTCSCHKQQVGCTRVAVVDGAITPLRFAGDELPWRERVEFNVAAVHEALTRLTAARDDQKGGGRA